MPSGFTKTARAVHQPVGFLYRRDTLSASAKRMDFKRCLNVSSLIPAILPSYPQSFCQRLWADQRFAWSAGYGFLLKFHNSWRMNSSCGSVKPTLQCLSSWIFPDRDSSLDGFTTCCGNIIDFLLLRLPAIPHIPWGISSLIRFWTLRWIEPQQLGPEASLFLRSRDRAPSLKILPCCRPKGFIFLLLVFAISCNSLRSCLTRIFFIAWMIRIILKGLPEMLSGMSAESTTPCKNLRYSGRASCNRTGWGFCSNRVVCRVPASCNRTFPGLVAGQYSMLENWMGASAEVWRRKMGDSSTLVMNL